MKEVINSIGVLTRSDGNKIFTYSLESIRLNKYKTAGKYVRWSVYHGGPGIPVLNKYMFQLMVHEGEAPISDVQKNAVDSVDDVIDRNNLNQVYNAAIYNCI